MKKEQLYQKIKDKMPQNLSELEKSAYIMMVIAQNKEFSSQYYWSDKATRRKMYNKAINKEKIKLQNNINIAKKMLKENLDEELIFKVTGLHIAEIDND